MNSKKIPILVVSFALLLAIGSAAWACTPQTKITQLRPLSGPAGTDVTIEGFAVEPIEIRWNSVDGAIIASAGENTFAVGAAIPADAAPGVYYLMVGDRALETFEVTGNAEPSSASLRMGDLWSGFPTDSVSTQSEIAQSGELKGSGQRLFAGLALLAVGLSGVAGALAIAGRRRVRAHVRST